MLKCLYYLLPVDPLVADGANDTHEERAQESVPEAGDGKTFDEGGGEQEQGSINNERKESKSKYSNRESQ